MQQMYSQIFNLSLLHVTQKVDEVLANCSEYHFLKSPLCRNQLIAHVLNHIPNYHIVINLETLPKNLELPQCSLEEQRLIENLVRSSLSQMIEGKATWYREQKFNKDIPA